jgi:hypothetical protein
MTRFTTLLFLTIALVACKPQSDSDSVDVGTNYFPIREGAVRVYSVDSLAYDDNTGATTIDTFTYQYKEVIGSAFTDVSGQPAQLVNRFYRNHDSLPWIQATNATVMLTEFNVQKVEQNNRYVKLVFPLAVQKTWNGNMYTILDEEEYRVVSMDEAQTIGGKFYEQTLTVLQKDELNAIEEIKRAETYARNIGLVHLLSDSINTQVSGSRGFRYRLTLQSFTP